MTHATDESGQASEFRETLPELDEALGRLSAADRDLIMLRFQQGLRFNELGEQIGKSEDAARKRVARALSKLKSILGKRGMTATITALAAGLPIALGKAAPASARSVGSPKTSTAAGQRRAQTRRLPRLPTLMWKTNVPA